MNNLWQIGQRVVDEDGNHGIVVIWWDDGDICEYENDAAHPNPQLLREVKPPSVLRRIWLFLRIVWRRWEYHRIDAKTAWDVAGIVWGPPKGSNPPQAVRENADEN